MHGIINMRQTTTENAQLSGKSTAQLKTFERDFRAFPAAKQTNATRSVLANRVTGGAHVSKFGDYFNVE